MLSKALGRPCPKPPEPWQVEDHEYRRVRFLRRGCDWCEVYGERADDYGPKRAYFCSPECRQAYRRDAKKLAAEWKAEERAEAPLLCLGCATPMPERRQQQGYCSNACRQKAYRARRKGAA